MAKNESRRFRQLVRNVRNAGSIANRMLGCEFVRCGGHTYRLVPERTFDDALAMLSRIAGETNSAPDGAGTE